MQTAIRPDVSGSSARHEQGEDRVRGIERRVIDIVEELMAELGGRALPGSVAPQASLDRELGIGSLERVELLLRLETAFGVRLPDSVMAEAESPRDLAVAIGAAVPAGAEPLPRPGAPVGPGQPAPTQARTLVDVLRWHVERQGDRPHILLQREDESEVAITYGALWEGAQRLAGGLGEGGRVGGRSVALMLRTEEAFFHGFFGTLLAGGVPVPIYPPFRLDRIEEYAARQAGILRNAEAAVLLTFGPAERLARLLGGRVPSLEGVTTPERLARAEGVAASPHLDAGHTALIQYTSGSTGEPKGVVLSHANLLANIRAIGQAIAIGPDDIGVSWLPLYHDMGLIGTWLACLYFGIPIVILSPLAFLARPARWLRAIHAHRATLSPAPNFAFDLCVKKIAPVEAEGLDLGSWRLALNGSEPVSPDTIERFTRRFAPHGFRPEAMCPAYGLAEASVALTVGVPGYGPWVDRVAREPFQRQGQAQPAASGDPTALRFVSCGRPLAGHEVRVVDPAGRPVGERIEGCIEFRGPSVTRGYYRNPEATRAVLHDGWMDSGDLGYWARGELFLTGRRKDLVIKAGRNLYPPEIEQAVGDLPGIRRGCVAAFGLPDPAAGTERLVVVAESREAGSDRRAALRSAVLDRVTEVIGLPPDIVLIASPGAVLKTSSGKIRRTATREAFLRGALERRRPAAAAQWTRLLIQDLQARLRRLTGWTATIAYAAWVGVLVGATVPALWALVLLLPGGRAPDRIVRGWCRWVLRLAGCPLRVEGGEKLRSVAPAVLAANHASYLDAAALLAALPTEFRFVAKRELASAPLIGAVIRKVGHLTVDRRDPSRGATDAAIATAALHSASVLFFPEGTFRRSRELLPFRLGAFKAAVEARRPVVPIGIRGTREILPADAWLPRPGPITVAIGEPIMPDTGGWPEMVRLRDLTRSEIARLADAHGE